MEITSALVFLAEQLSMYQSLQNLVSNGSIEPRETKFHRKERKNYFESLFTVLTISFLEENNQMSARAAEIDRNSEKSRIFAGIEELSGRISKFGLPPCLSCKTK